MNQNIEEQVKLKDENERLKKENTELRRQLAAEEKLSYLLAAKLDELTKQLQD